MIPAAGPLRWSRHGASCSTCRNRPHRWKRRIPEGKCRCGHMIINVIYPPGALLADLGMAVIYDRSVTSSINLNRPHLRLAAQETRNNPHNIKSLKNYITPNLRRTYAKYFHFIHPHACLHLRQGTIWRHLFFHQGIYVFPLSIHAEASGPGWKIEKEALP